MTTSMGERLRDERRKIGLNQTQLGEIAGVGKTTQLKYEKGSSFPDASYLAAVSEVGVDILYVVTGRRTTAPVEALSVREQTVVYNFRALPEDDKAALQRLSNALAQSIDSSAAENQ